MSAQSWEDAQIGEAAWWGDCANTFGEESKQLVYGRHMGLDFKNVGGPGPVCDLGGRSVLDLGGGPCSLLLKCRNFSRAVVVDPCPYPRWVDDRYREHGVDWYDQQAEFFPIHTGLVERYDEVWIYNVLQHVEDPERVIVNARTNASVLRIFEWLNVPAHEGHPHELTVEALNGWIGTAGTTSFVNHEGAVGLAYYGVFDL